MKIGKLQGKVLDIEKTRESIGKDSEKWEKRIFTVELTKFSKRTPEEIIPENSKGKKVKLIRYCSFDWHYRIDVMKTLEHDETEAVLTGEPIKTVYW